MFGSHRLFLTVLAMLAVTAAGTVGYRVIEGASWSDAAFMTVITLSTVGYGEVVPLSPAGRLFTVILIGLGMTFVFAVITAWVKVVFEGELERALGRRRVKRVLRNISDHFIICGYGRFGRWLAEELARKGERFVVIDASAALPAEVVGFNADATEDKTLREAGVERARALLAALPSDADNVYVTLTAKELNPKIFVVSRCEHESGEGRLRRAGADRVVAPYAIGGHRMVELAMNPSLPVVVEVEDLTAASGREHMTVAEICIGAGSGLEGASVASGELMRRFGVLPIGLIGADGRLQVGVKPQSRLESGNVLVVFGSEHAIETMAAASKAARETTEVA